VPCQNSKAVNEFIQENKISMLDWPCNSPDMNSIGNLWDMLKKHLGKMDCSTEEWVVTNVTKVWFHGSRVEYICSKSVKSMPERVREFVSAKGGHTAYKHYVRELYLE
jgi:transposase